MPRPAAESGVTPVIGTILVLLISVAGIGVTLLVGVPVMDDLQERGNLQAMEGQFEQLRHDAAALNVQGTSRTTGVNLPQGTLSTTTGTSLLLGEYVTASASTSCELRAWADGDDTVVAPLDLGCPVLGNLAAACGPAPPWWQFEAFLNWIICVGLACDGGYFEGDCLVVERWDGAWEDVDVEVEEITNAVLLEHQVDTAPLWRFEIYEDGQPVHTRFYIAWSDAVRWADGGSEVVYEWGGLVETVAGDEYVHAMPRLLDGDPFVLGLTSIEADSSSLAGSGAHGIRMDAAGLVTVTDTASVQALRLDFAGERGKAWCDAFLFRNSAHAGTPYGAVPATSQRCSLAVGGSAPDVAYSVLYDPGTFGIHVSLSRLDTAIEV